MKETNQEVIDKLKEELAQEINSIEEINNNNPEPVKEITKEYREELISNMIESNQAMGLYDNDPIIEEIKEEPINTINNIEEMTDPNPLPPVNPDETATGTSQELKPKNTVRIMDGNFPF